MPRVVYNFLKSFSPIVAAPGEDCHRFICKMNLHPVAVKFDFVNPARSGWHFRNQRGESRINEPEERCLDADHRRFLALERHSYTKRMGNGS